MYREFGKDSSRETNNGNMRHKISQLLDLKGNIEEIFIALKYALENYPVEHYYQSEEENTAYQKKLTMLFINVIHLLDKYKKQLIPDHIEKIKREVTERLNLLKQIKSSEISHLVSIILQEYVYTGTSDIDKALSYLMTISGESITRPLL